MIRRQGGNYAPTNRSSNASMKEEAAKTSAFEQRDHTKKQLIDMYELFEKDQLDKLEDESLKEITALSVKAGPYSIISIG